MSIASFSRRRVIGAVAFGRRYSNEGVGNIRGVTIKIKDIRHKWHNDQNKHRACCDADLLMVVVDSAVGPGLQNENQPLFAFNSVLQTLFRQSIRVF